MRGRSCVWRRDGILEFLASDDVWFGCRSSRMPPPLLVWSVSVPFLSVSPVVSLGGKEMEKSPLVTGLSVFQNSELAQVFYAIAFIGRYFQLKLLKAKRTEVVQLGFTNVLTLTLLTLTQSPA